MSNFPIYDSASNLPHAIEELQEALQHRNLIFQLVRRDILTRYKRSFLGVAWTMLNPLGIMIILSFVFSGLFGTNLAYPAFVLTGLVAWNFFAQSTTAAMSSLVWGGGLLQRIYIPRASFGISAVGSGLVNLLFSFVPLFIVMIAIGLGPLPVRASRDPGALLPLGHGHDRSALVDLPLWRPAQGRSGHGVRAREPGSL